MRISLKSVCGLSYNTTCLTTDQQHIKLRLEPRVCKHTMCARVRLAVPASRRQHEGPSRGYPLDYAACLPLPEGTNRQQISCCRRVRIPGPSQTRNPEKQKAKKPKQHPLPEIKEVRWEFCTEIPSWRAKCLHASYQI